MKLVTLSAKQHDGHTNIAYHEAGMGFHIYPVHVYWFEDGLYVLGTAPEWQHLSGMRLSDIGNSGIDQVIARLTELIPRDNPMGIKRTAPTLMLVPEILQSIGVANSHEDAQLGFESADGQQHSTHLNAVTFQTYRQTVSIPKRINPPLYLREAEAFYWQHWKRFSTPGPSQDPINLISVPTPANAAAWLRMFKPLPEELS